MLVCRRGRLNNIIKSKVFVGVLQLRILILANFDLGLYQFRRELIQELLKENNVYISLPYGKLVDPLVDAGCIFIDTPMERRGINPVKDLSLLSRYFCILSDIRPDLVVSYTIKPNIYGGWACRVKKIPYAVNITGLGTAFENDGLLKKMVITMYKAVLKKAKVVFFENSANRDLFVKEGIVCEEKTCVLNGAGVNLEHFAYAPYPHNDVFHLLFIGRVMKEKGIDELFEAMMRLVAEGQQCFLDVVGPFEEDYEERLRKYEKAGWLKYHGFQEDVRPFISACDCFVLPSYHEGMANTNLEAAAMGRPVITSNIPGCREAVIDGVSGYLCEPKDVESLHHTMHTMMGIDRNQREGLGKMGRKNMERFFDKTRIVNQTIDIMFGI